MSADYEKPRQRKGYTLTSVRWSREGKVIGTTYEPVRKARAAQAGECSDCGRPGPAFEPCRYCGPGAGRDTHRGAVAAERDPFSRT